MIEVDLVSQQKMSRNGIVLGVDEKGTSKDHLKRLKRSLSQKKQIRYAFMENFKTPYTIKLTTTVYLKTRGKNVSVGGDMYPNQYQSILQYICYDAQ